MEQIKVNGELIIELKDKQDWINRCPRHLPKKQRMAEQWVWIDNRGFVFYIGADFAIAEELNTYPCKVYRLISLEEAKKNGM